MKLYYYRHAEGRTNFGDDLNPWLWRQVIADLLDDDASTVLLGAGTLLNSDIDKRVPIASDKVVLGSGVGYGPPPEPEPGSGRWRIYWLRGPLSAAALGLEPSLAISDPAMLLANFVTRPARPVHRFGFMPHLASLWAGSLPIAELCERLPAKLIDPRESVDQVAREIASCETLMTEALHGAVVADSLRVPWIALKSTPRLLDFKWHDWCGSLGIEYRPRVLPPLWDPKPDPRLLDRTKRLAKYALVRARLRRIMTRQRPTLSDDSTQRRLLDRMVEACERFRVDARAGKVIQARGCDLQDRGPQPARKASIAQIPLTVGTNLQVK